MKLSRMQADVLPVLRWLLDPFAARGSGRTVIMAVAFIAIAETYRGRRIDVFDHCDIGVPYRSDGTIMTRTIERILSTRPDLARCTEINHKEGFIVCHTDFNGPIPTTFTIGIDESAGSDWVSIGRLIPAKKKPQKKKPARKISHVAD